MQTTTMTINKQFSLLPSDLLDDSDIDRSLAKAFGSVGGKRLVSLEARGFYL